MPENSDSKSAPHTRLNRRTFLKTTGLTVIAGGMGSVLVACGEEGPVTPSSNPGAIVPGVNNTTAATSPATRSGQSTVPASTGAAPTPRAGTPGQATTSAAVTAGSTPLETATQYLRAWEQGKFAEMYELVSANARKTISQPDYVQRHVNITSEATILAVQARPSTGAAAQPATQSTAEVPFQAAFKTGRVGDFSQNNVLRLVAEGGSWKVDWTPAAFFKELDNSTYLVRMIRDNPPRGQISARNNQSLSAPTTLYEIFVVPGQIDNEEQLLTDMSQLLAMDKEKIKNLYKNGQPNWRMPIKNLPASTPPETIAQLRNIKGVGVDEGKTRGYPQGLTASHTVGYINAVNAEDLKTLAVKGYTEDDVIGRTGLEAWGEEILAGGLGGKLTIIRRDGATVATLAQRASTPPANLITNLDLNIQKAAEAALGERQGSVVVMDPNNGAVLALANFPAYDPNLFINGLSGDQFKALNDDPRRPFSNRAVNGQLPIGSVFKAITTAAALERGGLNMQTRFTCTGRWTGLGEQFAKDCYIKTGHGSITLYEGLVQSCDVVFYELGKKLDEIDPNLLPTITKSFGFGSSTKIAGLYDSPGQVPDPVWKQERQRQAWFRGDAVNLGIGQGYFLASPLQVAVAYAAIANGGNLPVPRLVERAESSSPQANKTFPVQSKGRLPVSEANLAEIRRALLGVTQGGLGTARQAFAGVKVPVAGKTGTAESGVEQPHAWFACYAPADKPRYVVVVLLENGGYGNAIAAPTARKVIDALPF